MAAAPEPGTPPPAPAQVAALDTWEYRWALARPRGEDLGELAEFGAEGWDVVGPVSEGTGGYWTFLMKRPLPPAPSTPAP
ncbi:hypothetical protein [Streptomyces clavuligerus]|uniref:hypothetical protein n=1 Tax=Streptomyces clavuligerus TaxID=1901 RepID=UPI000E4E94C9|nr:hypothetical protein [Streptomyces clavuligerus]AXU17023.1 hypothetical protein D1794_30770 [Streptomyces clavuligerus]